MNDRICVIACGTLALDIQRIVKEMDLAVGTRFLPGGLHENPTQLHREVQAAIDEVSASADWDRIVIGYGLCGRGTVGLRAREIPLVIPRVHDCISLFLGGNAAYKQEFERYPGTYYISAGWYEEKTEPLSQKNTSVYLEGKQVSFEELVARYGPRKAQKTYDFLNSWQRNYQRAAFIDTGLGNDAVSIDHARKTAQRYGWKYELLKGDTSLIRRLFSTASTTDEILVVFPGYVTYFETRESRLQANPPATEGGADLQPHIQVEKSAPNGINTQGKLKIGLGIDAGGTYTDAVIYDLSSGLVLGKNKAPTTKWQYTIGIDEALNGLDRALLGQVELVAVSTTLATNAIVEGDGQKVGLILMPPYGLFDDNDIPHKPKAVIAGRLDISGTITQDLDGSALRRTAREMIDRQGVKAFAVSGFAGSINPEHELAVKRILEEETGCFVSCGHELSTLLNFRTRAETAVQNARIVPRLVKLLGDLQTVLSSFAVRAPVMVVKGDGSLMSSDMAVARPVETILSGPAASVAGARFLSKLTDAIVVDMGGTTTDTATLKDGRVKVVAQGSRVGGVQTHVRALEIRTTGLGGDSLISYDKGKFTVGPRRVAPMVLLGLHNPGPEKTMDFVEARLNSRGGSSKNIQVFTLTDHYHNFAATEAEAEILARLGQRPYSLEELAETLGVIHPSLVPLARLRDNYIIQGHGLTPTDLLHVDGAFSKWDSSIAHRAISLFAALADMSSAEIVEHLLADITKRLALELVKKQLEGELPSGISDDCQTCRLLLENIFTGGKSDGKSDYRVRFKLNRPVIGIGAPIGFFLPKAAEILETEAILPEHAEVANAIGAITSHISVQHRVKIHPRQSGGFFIEGLPGALHYATFNEADAHAREALCDLVRRLGREAGTGETAVDIETEDSTAGLNGGGRLFLERTLTASLVGPPDLASQTPALFLQ
jgi:N-methylhydantoinase A/oxoprolinase/acetone carboxylase beta subunit